MSGDDRRLLITDAEWRAALLGARILRDTAASFRGREQEELAAESDGHAEALEGLARRATVAAVQEQGPDLRLLGPAPETDVERETER